MRRQTMLWIWVVLLLLSGLSNFFWKPALTAASLMAILVGIAGLDTAIFALRERDGAGIIFLYGSFAFAGFAIAGLTIFNLVQ